MSLISENTTPFPPIHPVPPENRDTKADSTQTPTISNIAAPSTVDPSSAAPLPKSLTPTSRGEYLIIFFKKLFPKTPSSTPSKVATVAASKKPAPQASSTIDHRVSSHPPQGPQTEKAQEIMNRNKKAIKTNVNLAQELGAAWEKNRELGDNAERRIESLMRLHSKGQLKDLVLPKPIRKLIEANVDQSLNGLGEFLRHIKRIKWLGPLAPIGALRHIWRIRQYKADLKESMVKELTAQVKNAINSVDVRSDFKNEAAKLVQKIINMPTHEILLKIISDKDTTTLHPNIRGKENRAHAFLAHNYQHRQFLSLDEKKPEFKDAKLFVQEITKHLHNCDLVNEQPEEIRQLKAKIPAVAHSLIHKAISRFDVAKQAYDTKIKSKDFGNKKVLIQSEKSALDSAKDELNTIQKDVQKLIDDGLLTSTKELQEAFDKILTINREVFKSLKQFASLQ